MSDVRLINLVWQNDIKKDGRVSVHPTARDSKLVHKPCSPQLYLVVHRLVPSMHARRDVSRSVERTAVSITTGGNYVCLISVTHGVVLHL